jgi:hypothetical protein
MIFSWWSTTRFLDYASCRAVKWALFRPVWLAKLRTNTFCTFYNRLSVSYNVALRTAAESS